MRYLFPFLLSMLVTVTGCSDMWPSITTNDKAGVCDRDVDGLWRNDPAGYCGGTDCDDDNPNVGEPSGWYRDVDGDAFGAGEASFSCTQPDGFVDIKGDCDDTDELVNPDALETCNGYDDNCDGNVDDENVPIWYADLDLDGYGDPAMSLTVCDQPDGYVDNNLDCDDTTSSVSPDDVEICDDNIDQDCNGLVDDAENAQRWHADTDGDGYGDEDVFLYSCLTSVEGYVLDATDCDDRTYDTSPAAFEACGDGIDNDCDGTVDTDAGDVPWYRDADEDSYGDPSETTTDCAPPTGYVGNTVDCDDTATEVNPGVEEVCNNGVDDNCDGSANECRFNGSLTLLDEAVTWIVADGGDFGRALAFSDFNGDGQDDLAVGAYKDANGGEEAGAVLFFWGPLTQTGELDASLYNARILGDVASQFGRDTEMVGDVSGDGLDDLAVSAVGNDRVYVFFLPIMDGELVAADADVIISGLSAGSCGTTPGNGESFAIGNGDLNDDGETDLIVGGCDSNTVGVFWSPLTRDSGNIASAGAVLQGVSENDRYGSSIAVADFSGDGLDDLAVGAPEANGNNSGSVYVYVGSVSSNSTPDYTFIINSNDRYGTESFAVDLNGDGIMDLCTASRQVTGVRVNWGGALTSTSNIGTATWNATLGAGEDLDGDGVPDLLIAQQEVGGDTCGTASCVSIVYGSSTTTPVSTATWYATSYVPVVGSGAPEFTLDGVPDILIGTPEENTVWLMAGTGI